MIMEVAENEKFIDLAELLSEMCEFLNSILPKLPENIQEKARGLINKTRQNPEYSTYMRMNRHSTGAADSYVTGDFSPDDYECVEEHLHSLQKPFTEATTIKFPYENLSAKKMIEMNVKHGDLQRLRRFNFLWNKKWFAGLVDNWMIFYDSQKDTKPNHFINLTDYIATSSNSPYLKEEARRTCAFELKSPIEGKKSYGFIARQPKDGIQWVAQINKVYNQYSSARKTDPIHSSSVDVDIYYDVGDEAPLNMPELLPSPAITNGFFTVPLRPRYLPTCPLNIPETGAEDEIAEYTDVPAPISVMPRNERTVSESSIVYDEVGPGAPYSNAPEFDDEMYADISVIRTHYNHVNQPVMTSIYNYDVPSSNQATNATNTLTTFLPLTKPRPSSPVSLPKPNSNAKVTSINKETAIHPTNGETLKVTQNPRTRSKSPTKPPNPVTQRKPNVQEMKKSFDKILKKEKLSSIKPKTPSPVPPDDDDLQNYEVVNPTQERSFPLPPPPPSFLTAFRPK